MNLYEMNEEFEKHDVMEEFGEFHKVSKHLSERPDLHAFILLDKLCPSNKSIVSESGHDQFWLNVDVNDFAKVATPELILALIRCGVMFDYDEDCLYMFP